MIHVTELTQPQGHSTSGSHERYKSPERLKWEHEFDCIRKMRDWMIGTRLATEAEIAAWEKEDYEAVEDIRKTAWADYLNPILAERSQVMDMLDEIASNSPLASELNDIKERLAAIPVPLRRDIHVAAHEALRVLRAEENPSKQILMQWKIEQDAVNLTRYGSHLYNELSLSIRVIPNPDGLRGH
jgi:hypothetical protein